MSRRRPNSQEGEGVKTPAPVWRDYFNGADSLKVFGPDYLGSEAMTEERQETPTCMAGAKTEHPCGRKAEAKLGKTFLCYEHSRMPGASEAVSNVEACVWHLKQYQGDAQRTRNSLLVGLLEDALDEAEEHRREAYENLEVPKRIALR